MSETIHLMSEKKIYVWHLAQFLVQHNMRMSGQELAEHLNRNNIVTSYGKPYTGGRGTYALIKATYDWTNEKHGKDEAKNVAIAYVNANGQPAYE